MEQIKSIKSLLDEEDALVKEYNSCVQSIQFYSDELKASKKRAEENPNLIDLVQRDIDYYNILIQNYTERLPSLINDINSKRDAMRERLVI